MATISAFIRSVSEKKDREVNIRFRLTDGRKIQLFYKSDLSILPRLWSNDTQTIKAKVSYNEPARILFNRRVEDIKQRILDWYVGQCAKEDLTSADLQSYMERPADSKISGDDFTSLYERFLAERDCSADRVEQLRVGMRDVQRYEAYISITIGAHYAFDVHTVTAQTLRSFERFLADEYKIAEQYPELYAERRQKQKPRGYNTIRNRLIYLRSFFLWLRENEITSNNPFKAMKVKKAVYGSAIYITISELHILANIELEPWLSRYRDLYVFQSSIGCRVSDLHLLCGRNIVNGCVEYIARKTAGDDPVTVRVPMNKLATSVYERYKKDNPNDLLFPVFNDQCYNRGIKRIFKEAGLDRWVQRINSVTREPEQVRLCDIAASHMARKTLIGNVYKKFRDQNLVSELTGHRTNSEAFVQYRDVDMPMLHDMVSVLDE